MNPRVIDYLDEFVEALKQELEEAEERWGNTWLARDKDNQVDRIFERHDEYSDWLDGDSDFPWLSVAGNAMIAWIRNTHPELSEAWNSTLDNEENL